MRYQEIQEPDRLFILRRLSTNRRSNDERRHDCGESAPGNSPSNGKRVAAPADGYAHCFAAYH
jgi:hypothetical protein